MFPPKKYIKISFKQGVIVAILLGVIPLLLALCQDIWGVIFHKSHDLSNFNEMMKSLIPSNDNYVHILLWLSGIYCLPLLMLVVAERELERKIPIPSWIKHFILNFEYALSAIFSVMFVASAIFFTTGFFFCFTSLGVSYGIGFVFIGIILFTLTMYALAAMLEFKDLFLKDDFDSI
ncbi:hypothetical protein CAP42_14025 [Acinetobacter indicus]|mgnify:FL=1|uniref:DUF2975 domain-containing protein n=1 Tax=Acinetobacter haemolyticus TaxID=29430 RepID=A0AAJ2YVT7_ACIHA|nr:MULTISPECIES: hypothetical protein [Acinetobacter]NAR74798.1 hypothetical protein [Acinetobacter haemolyticus]OUY06430.1 hypothetical protein CAP42_14025 [Acinetobacter indicus]QHI31168.1 hypothetical protein AhaeINNSZ174_17180 [Acinetobacter haemolyticus]